MQRFDDFHNKKYYIEMIYDNIKKNPVGISDIQIEVADDTIRVNEVRIVVATVVRRARP